MTIRSVYFLVFRVFGLFLVKDILMVIPYLVSPVLIYFDSDFKSESLLSLILPFIVICILILVSWFFLFRPHKILDKINLEAEELNEPLTVSISAKSVILVSIIVTTGLLFLEEIPNFFKLLYQYYDESQIKFSEKKPSLLFLLISFVKILLGLLVFGERKRIVEFISKEIPEKQ